MSEDKVQDPQGKKGGLMAGFVMILFAVIVAGGYYYYTNHMAPAGNEEVAAAPAVNAAQTQTAAGENTQPAPAQETAVAQQPQPQPELPNPLGVPAFSPDQVQPGNPVVAKVGNMEITRLEVFSFIQQMPPQMQQLPPQQVYPIALEQVVNAKLVQGEADKANLEETDIFKAQLENSKQQIKRTLFIQQKMASVITEEKLKALYDERVKDVPDVEERQARHILVETEEEAKKLIEDLKGGADFAELAKEHSKGPTGERGGDLGWFAQNEMVPEFSEAAFAGSKGAFLDMPVKTQFGWHVVKVEDVRVRPKPTMQEMQNILMAELQREALNDYIQELREGATIEVFDVNGNVPGQAPVSAPAPAPQAEPSAGETAPAPAQ